MGNGSEGERVVSGRPVRLIHMEDDMSLDEDIGGRAGERTYLRETLDVELIGLVLDCI